MVGLSFAVDYIRGKCGEDAQGLRSLLEKVWMDSKDSSGGLNRYYIVEGLPPGKKSLISHTISKEVFFGVGVNELLKLKSFEYHKYFKIY